MNPYYPTLFSPIQVNGVTLKNRFCLAPMSFLELNYHGGMTKYSIDFYERVAKGGAALVTIGETIVSRKTGRSDAHLIRLLEPGAFYSLCEVAEAVHRHGALISAEISHAGALCIPKNNYGNLPMSASAYVKPTGVPVTEMTEEQMIEVAEEFGEAALTLKKAGFDMVMFHAGHGWLIHQFLSPRTNKRTDKYGGSAENRTRFPIMCLKSIREKCGPRFPIDMRITGDEIVENGYHIDTCIENVKLLAPYVDMIQVSAGGVFDPVALRRMSPGIFFPRGCNVHLAEAVKSVVDVPVTCVGGLVEPDMMEEILTSGKADGIVMGRGLICDSDLPVKTMRGKYDEVSKCMRCFECHGRLYEKGWLKCTINPKVSGRPDEEMPYAEKLPESRKVVVVGGGVGGMQAALTASERGHDVTLIEKNHELGGAIRFSDYVDFKKDMAYYMHQTISKLKKSSVKIMLDTEANSEMINEMKPDVLIIAVGADPVILPIPGIDSEKVIIGATMNLEKHDYGQNVVIIGGGLVGCESAVELKDEGKNVTVVEMLSDIAAGTSPSHRNGLDHALKGIQVMTNTKCLGINDVGVMVQTADGEEITLPADSIILSAGLRARSAVVDELRKTVVPETIVIGDASAARKMGDAIHEGYHAAMNL